MELTPGAKQSITKNRNALLRKATKEILAADLPKGELRRMLRESGLPETSAAGIALAQVLKAFDGDTDAARFVRDTAGEKPREAFDVDLRPVCTENMAEYTDEELMTLAEESDGG